MLRTIKKWIVKGVPGLATLAVLALIAAPVQAQTGFLDPPFDAVDASGNPVPTTQTQPSWDWALVGRYVDALSTAVSPVLDKITGLVWERVPGTIPVNWDTARAECANKSIGGWMGWRLPATHELTSLLFTVHDPSTASDTLVLDVGPFIISAGAGPFWTAQTDAADPTQAWLVVVGQSVPGVVHAAKIETYMVWCVRGGSAGPSTY